MEDSEEKIHFNTGIESVKIRVHQKIIAKKLQKEPLSSYYITSSYQRLGSACCRIFWMT